MAKSSKDKGKTKEKPSTTPKQEASKNTNQRSKDVFVWFQKNPWVVISWIIGGVFVFFGGVNDILDFVQRWSSDRRDILIVFSILAYLAILVTAVYLLRISPQKFSKGTLQVAKGLIPLLIVLPILFWGYTRWQSKLDEKKLIILIADIYGPEVENYQVTENIISKMKSTLKDYDDVILIPLGESISEKLSSDEIDSLMDEHHADLLIWGRYSIGDNGIKAHFHLGINAQSTNHIVDSLDAIRKSQNEQPPIKIEDRLEFSEIVSDQIDNFSLFVTAVSRFAVSDYSECINRLSVLIDKIDGLENNSLSQEIYFYRGTSYFETGKFALAINDLTKSIDGNGQFPGAFYNRGRSYEALKDYQSAVDDYTNAIRLQPDLIRAYISRGYLYSELGLVDNTISDFSMAIKLDPTNAVLLNNRGKVFLDAQNYDSAINDFTTAISLDPDFASLYNERGRAYYHLADINRTDPNSELLDQKALADLNKALILDPLMDEAYSNRALVWIHFNQPEKAKSDFSESLRIDPTVKEVYFNRGSLYIEISEYDKAILDFSKVIELDSADSEAFIARASAYLSTEKTDLAIADYSSAINLDPNIFEAHTGRAIAYISIGDKENAILDFRKALLLTEDPKMKSQIEETLGFLSVDGP